MCISLHQRNIYLQILILYNYLHPITDGKNGGKICSRIGHESDTCSESQVSFLEFLPVLLCAKTISQIAC
jgi:hypothetical protein